MREKGERDERRERRTAFYCTTYVCIQYERSACTICSYMYNFKELRCKFIKMFSYRLHNAIGTECLRVLPPWKVVSSQQRFVLS